MGSTNLVQVTTARRWESATTDDENEKEVSSVKSLGAASMSSSYAGEIKFKLLKILIVILRPHRSRLLTYPTLYNCAVV